jgi:anaphase-promoting complex subunit 2
LDPIHQVRKDTVRCIVTSLTSDTNSELFEELAGSDHRELTGNAGDDSEEEAEAGDCARWKPDPIEADPAKTSQSRKTNDILSMLVTIYGSQVQYSLYTVLYTVLYSLLSVGAAGTVRE